MTAPLARLARFAAGANAASTWPGEGAAELMRADVRAALDAALTWSNDWSDLREGEEVLVAIVDVPTNRRAQVLARLKWIARQPPPGARAVRERGGGWVIWQSTWGGEPLPDTFRPYAYARPVPPEPAEDA